MTLLAIWLMGIGSLFALWQWFVKKNRCFYCGATHGHEEHCPFNGSGLSGGS